MENVSLSFILNLQWGLRMLSLFVCLFVCLFGWLVGWLVGRLVAYLVACLLFVCLFVCLWLQHQLKEPIFLKFVICNSFPAILNYLTIAFWGHFYSLSLWCLVCLPW